MCRECTTLEYQITSGKFCIVCSNQLSRPRLRAKATLCAACDAASPTRIEHIVRDMLLPLVNFEHSSADKILGGKACENKVRRPDLAWYGADRAVFVEIDEDSHSDDQYTTACELGKLGHQTDAVKKLRGENTLVFMVRMNPNAYDKRTVTLKERVQQVADLVNVAFTTDPSELPHGPAVPQLAFCYYHTKAQRHIDAALANPDSVSVYVVE